MRASVDLPEPLSPTSAMHSPCPTVRLTSSTALSGGEPRRRKVLETERSSRTGMTALARDARIEEPAARLLRRVAALEKRRHRAPADLHDGGAARREGAVLETAVQA